jgi:hypothetical protein
VSDLVKQQETRQLEVILDIAQKALAHTYPLRQFVGFHTDLLSSLPNDFADRHIDLPPLQIIHHYITFSPENNKNLLFLSNSLPG